MANVRASMVNSWLDHTWNLDMRSISLGEAMQNCRWEMRLGELLPGKNSCALCGMLVVTGMVEQLVLVLTNVDQTAARVRHGSLLLIQLLEMQRCGSQHPLASDLNDFTDSRINCACIEQILYRKNKDFWFVTNPFIQFVHGLII